jgi:hypothetical protein
VGYSCLKLSEFEKKKLNNFGQMPFHFSLVKVTVDNAADNVGTRGGFYCGDMGLDRK